MRKRLAVLAAAAMCAIGGPAGANGTILTAGASLATGTAPAQGSIFSTPSSLPIAPPSRLPLPELGELGAMPETVGTFPGGGTGADGAFLATEDMTVAGGTLNYTTYEVQSGVTVTYTSSVTILATGDVTIDGVLQTDAEEAPLTVQCAGSFTVGVAGDIFGNQDDSPVTLDIGLDFTGPEQDVCSIDGDGGTTIRTYGLAEGTGDIDLGSLSVDGGGGDVEILAARSFRSFGGRVNTGSAALMVKALGGDIDVAAFNLNIGFGGTMIAFEASGNVIVGDNTSINTGDGHIEITAFGGDVTFRENARTNTSTGNIDYRASGSIIWEDDCRANTSQGNITLTAFGGDVILIRSGDTGRPNLNTSMGNLTLQASRNIEMNDDINMNTATGDHIVRAHGGSLTFAGIADFPAFSQTNGRMEFNARDSVTGTVDRVSGDQTDISAGAGGIDLTVDGTNDVDANQGALNIISIGDVRLVGDFEGDQGVSVTSLTGDVDVSDAEVFSGADFSLDGISSDVVISSFGGSGSVIDAAGGTLRTGNALTRSGDLHLRVHAAPAIEAKSVALTLPGTRRRPQLRISGSVDMSAQQEALAARAEVSVGGRTIVMDPLLSARGGKQFDYRDDTVRFSLIPPRSGSSRARFVLHVREDFTGFAELDGPLPIRLSTARFQAVATVVLDGGRYRGQRLPGTLIRPGAYVQNPLVRLRGEGRDTFAATLGYAAPANIPGTAPDFRFDLGDNISVTIPGGDFTPRGSRFVFRGNVNGVTNVTIDARRGRVTVRGKEATFGAGEAGLAPLRVLLGVGNDVTNAFVGAQRTAKTVKY